MSLNQYTLSFDKSVVKLIFIFIYVLLIPSIIANTRPSRARNFQSSCAS